MTPVDLSSYQLMFITFKKWSGPPFGENPSNKMYHFDMSDVWKKQLRSPAASICHSWWTPAHVGPGVCGSSRTATGPEWWRVWSGCGYPTYGPVGGPAWTEGAVWQTERRKGEWIHEEMFQDHSLRTESVYLVVKHEKDGATNTHITWPLHLETIGLLGCRSPMPLKWYKQNLRNK